MSHGIDIYQIFIVVLFSVYVLGCHLGELKSRDEDPVLAKNRIRGSVPQTQTDFKKSIE